MPAVSGENMWAELLREDPKIRDVMLKEVRELIMSGEVETAKVMLRTLIKGTCGFSAISNDVGRNSKSISRMLSPDTDPGIKAFMAVVNAAERHSAKAVH